MPPLQWPAAARVSNSNPKHTLQPVLQILQPRGVAILSLRDALACCSKQHVLNKHACTHACACSGACRQPQQAACRMATLCKETCRPDSTNIVSAGDTLSFLHSLASIRPGTTINTVVARLPQGPNFVKCMCIPQALLSYQQGTSCPETIYSRFQAVRQLTHLLQCTRSHFRLAAYTPPVHSPLHTHQT